MKTYLITGGAGFIGSHLSDLYLERGDAVIVVDNLITGNVENVRHNFDNPRFRMIIDTVVNRKTMEPLVREADAVIHLAAPVGVKLIMERPVHALLDNVRGTDVVLELCNKYRKRVFVASSSEVYGRNQEFLTNGHDDRLAETAMRVMGSTKNHRWAYANTKSFDEFLAFAYGKEYGLPVVVGRYFNTVGPRQTGQYGMVVPNFVKSALRNDPIHIYGDGTQTRCFAYVSDVVYATATLMETDNALGEAFNIGGLEEISIADLAKKIVAMTESGSEIKYIDYTTAYGDGFEDMLRRTPNIDRLRKTIGYEPKFTLDQILSGIIDFHKNKGL